MLVLPCFLTQFKKALINCEAASCFLGEFMHGIIIFSKKHIKIFPTNGNGGIINLMLFWSGKMTANKSTKEFVWSEAEPMKDVWLGESSRASYDAERRDYGKKSAWGI